MSYQFSDNELIASRSRSFDENGEESPSYVEDEGQPLVEEPQLGEDGGSPSEWTNDNEHEYELDHLTYEELETGVEVEGEKVPSDNVPTEPVDVDPTADIPVVIKDNIKYMSTAQIKAARYLQKKHIFELFNFLLGHLLGSTPSDPILFLDNLLERCIAFRNGDEDVEPPLVFTPQHIAILFKSFDPIGVGSITMTQYRTAMMTLGINDYNDEPKLEDEEGNISEVTFCREAEECVMRMLREMLQIHRPCSMPILVEASPAEGAEVVEEGGQPDYTSPMGDDISLVEPEKDPNYDVVVDPPAENPDAENGNTKEERGIPHLGRS